MRKGVGIVRTISKMAWYLKWQLPYVIFMKHLWIFSAGGNMIILNQIWDVVSLV